MIEDGWKTTSIQEGDIITFSGCFDSDGYLKQFILYQGRIVNYNWKFKIKRFFSNLMRKKVSD